MLGTRSVSDFFGFWNICTYLMRYLGDGTQYGIHLCFVYTLLTKPEANFITTFLAHLCFECDSSREVKSGIFHQWCLSVLRMFWILEDFRFHIFRLGLLSLYCSLKFCFLLKITGNKFHISSSKESKKVVVIGFDESYKLPFPPKSSPTPDQSYQTGIATSIPCGRKSPLTIALSPSSWGQVRNALDQCLSLEPGMLLPLCQGSTGREPHTVVETAFFFFFTEPCFQLLFFSLGEINTKKFL